MQETLPAPERVPLRWLHSSPFGFLELFRRGRTMSTLGLMTMLAWVGDTGGQPTPAEQACNNPGDTVIIPTTIVLYEDSKKSRMQYKLACG